MTETTGAYWIYQNMNVRKAVLHRGSCVRCNDGQGQHGTRNEARNWWTSYTTLQEARSAPLRASSVLREHECVP
jgi:hypothetical protein